MDSALDYNRNYKRNHMTTDSFYSLKLKLNCDWKSSIWEKTFVYLLKFIVIRRRNQKPFLICISEFWACTCVCDKWWHKDNSSLPKTNKNWWLIFSSSFCHENIHITHSILLFVPFFYLTFNNSGIVTHSPQKKKKK